MSNRTTFIGSIVGLSLVAAGGVSTMAYADVAAYRSSGISATADFNRTDETGCTFEQVNVTLYESSYRDNQGGAVKGVPAAYMFINSYDWCAGTGYGAWGDVAIESFALAKNLSNASLKGTAQLQSWDMDGNLVEISMSVDIAWTGTGEIERGSYSTRSAYTGFRYSESYRGSWRPADTAGVVSDGVNTYDFSSQSGDGFTWTYGSLSTSKSRYLSIVDGSHDGHSH